MKKVLIVFLILLGFIVGLWLARENRKLFELPFPVEEPPGEVQQGRADKDKIIVGMEIWQVKEVLGVPEKINVLVATRDMKKEEWIYESTCYYFTNGVLTSCQERKELKKTSDVETKPNPDKPENTKYKNRNSKP